ncbi:MAG TPA: hypothetical protein VL285_15415, partial [Bryobacteraceae bacterium]|nr:hypothetical protein [Bryobacteraceae bacterium]
AGAGSRHIFYTRNVEHKSAGRRKTVLWAALGVGLVIAVAVLIVVYPRLKRERSLIGVVLIENVDPRKQLPIQNVEITAEAGGVAARAKTDAAGFFRLSWRALGWRREQVALRVSHPDYELLEVTVPLSDEFFIARLKPSGSAQDRKSGGSEVLVSNIHIRYAVKATTVVNVGSTTKTFEVVNVGNVPCEGRTPCSPDGKWKAAVGSLSLDAGERQSFQNVRVSCIAGPCPFTRIESDGFSRGGRKIDISVRAWSDTVTFLVEAEVVHTMLSDTIRRAYPSIFGRAMTFTMPPTGQGPSIEAEVDGLQIVFPLGPDLKLSWASCGAQIASNRIKLYSCELNPGYRFK